MKICLLTDMPPCRNFTAGIVLDILCNFLLEAGHEVCCLSVVDKAIDPVIPEDKRTRMKFESIRKPRENWGILGRIRGIRSLVSFIGNNAVALFKLPGIAKKAANFAKCNHADIIWNVVQGQTMIKITRPTAKIAGLPYVIHIWDHPTWWLHDMGFDRFTTRFVLNEFHQAVQHSQCCITASEAMAEDYKQRYNAPKALPVILGFNPGHIMPSGKKNNGDFVIALSGQMYASDELMALIGAISQLRWQYADKDIVLRLYGRYFNLGKFSTPVNIEWRGWLSQDELLAELANADLLYCPYIFDTTYADVSRLSFPSKLSTYMKTGTPVLFHGPDYSSPLTLLKRYNAAYMCDTLDIDALSQVISDIIKDPNRDTVAVRGYEAFEENLTLDIMRKNFFESLGCPIENIALE
ncbi:hypothetical protein AGMMS50276_30200 [Synergistales bacterium]|nr:hypothetical protein AGMMS50276_30200 [Synergistales bacterium]